MNKINVFELEAWFQYPAFSPAFFPLVDFWAAFLFWPLSDRIFFCWQLSSAIFLNFVTSYFICMVSAVFHRFLILCI